MCLLHERLHDIPIQGLEVDRKFLKLSVNLFTKGIKNRVYLPQTMELVHSPCCHVSFSCSIYLDQSLKLEVLALVIQNGRVNRVKEVGQGDIFARVNEFVTKRKQSLMVRCGDHKELDIFQAESSPRKRPRKKKIGAKPKMEIMQGLHIHITYKLPDKTNQPSVGIEVYHSISHENFSCLCMSG